MICVKAPAKVNLFLEVTGRRADGYHELATVFARVSLFDTLWISRPRRPGIRLRVEGGRVGGHVSENIVYKAAEKFFREFGIEPAAEIGLRKAIPVGAGLGGGSSDAAATLAGLARLYGLASALFKRRLMRLASELGSDVPFFLMNSMAASATGRGEVLRPLRIGGEKPRLLLVYPGEPVYTKEAYGALKPSKRGEVRSRVADFGKFKRLLAAEGLSPRAAALMFNRLEEPVLPLHPAVAAAKKKLAQAGAEAVMMSGSGAAVFAVFSSPALAAGAARKLACNKKYSIFRAGFC